MEILSERYVMDPITATERNIASLRKWIRE